MRWEGEKSLGLDKDGKKKTGSIDKMTKKKSLNLERTKRGKLGRRMGTKYLLEGTKRESARWPMGPRFSLTLLNKKNLTLQR